jgi:hypothetical protein
MESGLACQFSAKRKFVNGRSQKLHAQRATSWALPEDEARWAILTLCADPCRRLYDSAQCGVRA